MSSRRDRLVSMLADEPNDPFLRYGLALDYASAGEEATAAEHLRELALLNPDDPYIPAFLQLGQFLAKLGEETEAIDWLKKGISAAKLNGSGEALHAAGEMQGLLATLE